MRVKKMILFVSSMLAFTFLHLASAQTRNITGRITSYNDGTALPGVTIAVKNTEWATVSEKNGSYSIAVPQGAVTLVFSSQGYLTQELIVSASVHNIQLVPASDTLEKVVVIGYGSTRKRDLTGAVTSIQSNEFLKGNMTSPEQQIMGKVAGVSIVSNDGRPGAGSTIRIRGGSSLTASNDPLIVIDGVPLDNGSAALNTKVQGASNPLSFINPNDIESYTILKDASAAAIYGSRANNGVILITTKKGKSGKLKISFSSVNSTSKIANKVDVLSADQVREVIEATGSDRVEKLGNNRTDWQELIYQRAYGTDNNIMLSGGIKGLPYKLVLGYLSQSGVLKTDKMNRQSVSLSVNPTFFNNHLKLSLNVKGSAQQSVFANQAAIQAAITFDPTQPVYMDNQTYGGYFQWTEPDGSLVLNRQNNPLALLNQTFDKQRPFRSIGNLELDYRFHFLPDLRFNVNLGYDLSRNTGSVFVPATAASNFLAGGAYTPAKQSRNNTLFDLYFNYVKNLKALKSRVDLTAGYSYNDFSTKNYNFLTLNAARDTIENSTAPAFPFDIPQYTLVSFFGRLLYNYNDKIYLTASLRRDGSSRFSKANRWGWFPSAGIAWSLKNEWLVSNKKISELKLRVGYGHTGQQDGIGYYDYIGRYGVGALNASYAFDNTYYQTIGPYGYNAMLKWERLQSFNWALDFGFLDNRINGSIDYYVRTSKDLLNAKIQSAGTNFSAYVNSNVGSLENRGVELNLGFVPLRKNKSEWTINFNAAYNKNKILNLTGVENDTSYNGLPTGTANGVSGFVQLQKVGHPRSGFYLYEQVYDATGKPVDGQMVDQNKDGIINERDKVLRRTADPDFILGFNTSYSYSNWSIGTSLRAMLNNYVYNNVASNFGRLSAIVGNYIPGNGSASYLDSRFTGSSDLQTLSDYYVENASFLRMDNLYVGYNFNKRLFKDRAALRANIAVQNVFVITGYSGLDPEVIGGIDRAIYPRPRTISVSLMMDF